MPSNITSSGEGLTKSEIESLNFETIDSKTLKATDGGLKHQLDKDGYFQASMTSAERNAIVSPATFLKVIDSDLDSEMIFNGTIWVPTNINTIVGTVQNASAAGLVDVTFGAPDCIANAPQGRDGFVYAMSIGSSVPITSGLYQFRLNKNGSNFLNHSISDGTSSLNMFTEAQYLNFTSTDIITFQAFGDLAVPDLADLVFIAHVGIKFS